MRALVLRTPPPAEGGGGARGFDGIAVAQVPDARAPQRGEIRIAVHAAALNHLDLFVVEGLPGGSALSFPHVLGADGAGVVDAVGEGVTRVGVGDRVIWNPGISDYDCEFCRAGEHGLCVRYRLLGEHLPGTIAEFLTLPEQNVARLPVLEPVLSWSEAAAFSLVTLTAWRMIVTRARVQAGETVLLWGIGGGVSLTAMRIAQRLGARTIVTSSSDAKLARARELGADVTLNHTTQNVAQEVRALTGKRGVDVVVENVGAATWADSLRCLAKGGRLVTCGATSGPMVTMDVRRLFWNQYTIMGSTMGNAREYAAVVAALGRGELRPVVDRVFPIAEGRSAFEWLARAEHMGKVVVAVRK
ncbi:MAG TPA: zinc-binding dehydrogenase [Gemmatimonadaceae bacterium]